MKIVREEASGDLYIDQDCQYNELNADKVVVAPYVTARLYGTIKQSITIKKGSSVNLHGKVLGTVINEGGVLKLYEA